MAAAEQQAPPPKKSSPKLLLDRLTSEVRSFWVENEDRFNAAWGELARDGKLKFANAAVAATSQMCPQPDLLVPEINVEDLVDSRGHISKLFWYYYTDDGFKNDDKMISDLELTGQLQVSSETAKSARQMAILSCLNRLIDVYESIFHKVSENATGKAQFQKPLVAADLTKCAVCQASSKSSCGRCRSIAYCSASCQKTDWKQHKKKCKLLVEAKSAPPKAPAPDLSEPEKLKEKIREARKRAQEKQYMNQ